MARRVLCRAVVSATGGREESYAREVRPDTLEIFDVHTRKCVGKVLGISDLFRYCVRGLNVRYSLGSKEYGPIHVTRADSLFCCGVVLKLGMHKGIVRCSFECPHVELSDGEE